MVTINNGINLYRPVKLFVETGIKDHPVTQEILSKLMNIPVEYINDYRDISVDGDGIDNIYKESKKFLALAEKRGEFVKEFRCMDGLVGRTEYFIAHGNNCSFDCKYCFLQDYFDNAVPTVFVNHDEILKGVNDFILNSNDENLVFHAGELCDSFSFDFLTGFSRKLVNLFAGVSNARLELRTKSILIDNLLDIPGNDNVVVSWTFSPAKVIRDYEIKAPLLDERIEAASKIQNAGYMVGICIDPIIRVKGWAESYKVMINKLFDKLDVAKIAYISLGGFRYLQSLASSINDRGFNNNILSDEFVQSVDGKYRYFRPIRTEIYREIGKAIRERDSNVKVYLCMETPEVWNDVADDIGLVKQV